MNIKIRLESNIAALRMAKIRMENGYSPMDENEQIEVVRKWSGVGGTKGVLNDWNASKQQWIEDGVSSEDVYMYDKYQELFEAIRDLFPFSEHKKVIDSVRNATLTSFYTPEVIPRTFYEVLKDYMQVETIYEPSAGSGVFLKEAIAVFPEIEQSCAYEKDILTELVLKSITKSQYGHTIYNKPFEESSDNENDKYDLITSNIPFGDIRVYDPNFTDKNTCNKIHNYFFAKGIDKIRDGGVLAYLVTSAFLDTVSNRTVRKYLFDRCDFISLTVMPDNLMSETGGTMAPSHFLIVRKNDSKTQLSPEEEMLIESSFNEKDGKKYASNHYMKDYRETCLLKGSYVKFGKNQYGKPSIEVHWDKPISEIASPFAEILRRDFNQRYSNKLDNCNKGIEISVGKVKIIDRNHWEWDKETHDKAVDIAIEKSGLSDMFKVRSEWLTSSVDLTTTEIVDSYTNSEQERPDKEGEILDMFNAMGNEPIAELSKLLPEYIPFKNGIIVEI